MPKTYKQLMEETKQNQFQGIPSLNIPSAGDISKKAFDFFTKTLVTGALSSLIPRPGGANPAKQTQDQANIDSQNRKFRNDLTLDRQRQENQAKMARYSQGALGPPQERIKTAKTKLGLAQTEYTP